MSKTTRPKDRRAEALSREGAAVAERGPAAFERWFDERTGDDLARMKWREVCEWRERAAQVDARRLRGRRPLFHVIRGGRR